MDIIPAEKCDKVQCANMITYFVQYPCRSHTVEKYKKRLDEILEFEKKFLHQNEGITDGMQE